MADMNDLIGKEFKLGARGPDQFDCYGLSKEVLKRMGKEIPNYVYAEDVNDQYLNDLIAKEKLIVADKIDNPEPGCIVTFSIVRDLITHCGIMLDSDRFIHISRKTRVVVERIGHPLWKKKVRGFYRTKDIV
jgi:cell wall-associated NlpC family hydrolase